MADCFLAYSFIKKRIKEDERCIIFGHFAFIYECL